MGREIKRVALDFDWPLDISWKGYHNPYSPVQCKPCDHSGLNDATKKLSDDWYTHLRTDGREGWSRHLEQADVDALVAADRLYDLTHIWEGKWIRREDGHVPTAEEVNEWARYGMGHDSINQWICVEARAKRLGIYGECHLCKGNGYYWCEDKYEELHENWQHIEPPAGEGWQVWETVSEGSPITPVFPTKEGLIDYLAQRGDLWDQHRGEGGWGIARASAFVNAGWVPSMIMHDGEVLESKDIALDAKERECQKQKS